MSSRFKLCCVTLSPLFRSICDFDKRRNRRMASIRTVDLDVVLNIYVLTRVNFGTFFSLVRIFSMQCEYLKRE